MKKSRKKAGKKGIALVVVVVFLGAWFGALIITVKDRFFSAGTPASAQSIVAELPGPDISAATRYKILDRRHEDLAVSFKMHSVYARPLEISDTGEDVATLSDILGLDRENLLRDLRAERSFVWLGKHLPAEKTEEIQKKGLQGVYITNESQRYYPFHQRASHVVGFLKDGHGLAGVESYYDRMLRVSEEERSSKDSLNIKGHLVLSVDIRIQELLERQLGIVSGEVDAQSAMGIVMRPSNGEILAMASLPTYDPNIFWDFGAAERKNLVVNEMLHIGGISRLFRLAAYYENNERESGVKEVKQDSIEALKRSLKSEVFPGIHHEKEGYFSGDNGQKVSAELHWSEEFDLSVLQELKFNEFVGLTRESIVDLPVVNSINDTASGKDVTKNDRDVQIGTTTTAVSLMAAFSRIINDGSSVTPHLATGILGPVSKKMAKLRHKTGNSVLPDTSRKIKRFLRGYAGKRNGSVFIESFAEVRHQPAEENISLEDIQNAEGAGSSVSENRDQALAEQSRYQSVLLGFTPADKPDLVILIAFNGATVGFDKKTPMRIMAEKNFRLIRKLAEADEIAVDGGKDQSQYAKTYQEWLDSQQGKKKRAEANSDSALGLMPDLRGVSLRKALQIIQPYGLKIKINGSGTVVSQSPAKGEKIGKKFCVIELKEDRV